MSLGKDNPFTKKWRSCQNTFWNRFGSGLQLEDSSEQYLAFVYTLSLLVEEKVVYIHSNIAVSTYHSSRTFALAKFRLSLR